MNIIYMYSYYMCVIITLDQPRGRRALSFNTDLKMEAVVLEILTVLGCIMAKVRVGDAFWRSPANAWFFLIHYPLAGFTVGIKYNISGVVILVLQLVE